MNGKKWHDPGEAGRKSFEKAKSDFDVAVTKHRAAKKQQRQRAQQREAEARKEREEAKRWNWLKGGLGGALTGFVTGGPVGALVGGVGGAALGALPGGEGVIPYAQDLAYGVADRMDRDKPRELLLSQLDEQAQAQAAKLPEPGAEGFEFTDWGEAGSNWADAESMGKPYDPTDPLSRYDPRNRGV